MDRLRRTLRRSPSYEPLSNGNQEEGGSGATQQVEHNAFSWLDYSIFFLLGIAMLWAWNMFLAAGPYFQSRFQSSPWITTHFQSAELSISTIANLGSMLVLTKLQANASYPRRIIASLLINLVAFTLLAISTRVHTSAEAYFGFLMLMVFAASLATGLCQNGVFAYVAGFGREEYTQGIMTGQAVAGVLPPIVQVASVLSIPPQKAGEKAATPEESWKSAFAYFLTATGISAITLAAFFYLLARHRHSPQSSRPRSKTASATDSLSPSPEDSPPTDLPTDSPEERISVPLLTLLSKLRYLAAAVFLTFAITMVFPVFTQETLSVHAPSTSPPPPRILQPSAFIPLAFLLWNIGDLVGRLLTALPALRLTSRPRLLFALSVGRVVWIPLYFLCNIRGRGAVVPSDAFYLVVVQLLFGIGNGYLGSTCMMGAAEWVEPREREAAGGFMGLCLVSGLTVGSLLSFLVAGT
ncbi:hypothetical protein LTS18_004288 [Coniosporium uncinatum]|uniref:Uncharacterized protein n=1 Tax=Coniosporium uncinatum TaxID=93489 RepID=A0ACC3E046_9PEZI|nr:hypothetical protein LTS18_004288 [Coniosporium uncinatum]